MKSIAVAIVLAMLATPAMAQTFEASPSELEAARQKMLEADQADAISAVVDEDVASITCRLSTDAGDESEQVDGKPVPGRVGSSQVDVAPITVYKDQDSFSALLAALKGGAVDVKEVADEALSDLGVSKKEVQPPAEEPPAEEPPAEEEEPK